MYTWVYMKERSQCVDVHLVSFEPHCFRKPMRISPGIRSESPGNLLEQVAHKNNVRDMM